MLPFVVINIILLCIYERCYGGVLQLKSDSCLNLVNDCDAKPNTSIDNTFAFISCQNKLNERNGGCVVVPNGIYQVINVSMNTSNIIFYIDSSVTFIPWMENNIHNKSYPVFILGSTTRFIKNVSIIGMSSSNKFVIDLRNNTFTPWNVRGIQLFGINGFILSNINIKITTALSVEKAGIGFDYNNVNGVIYHAMNGKVINITASDYIFGYGLTQMQSGENIYFENLDGTGGVTLRLESGGGGAGGQNGYINNITGYNILCRNGHSSFMSQPHTQQNGFFQVYNLTSISCYIGYSYGSGYSQDGKPPGYFTNGSIVNNVMSYYGTHAQIDQNDTGPSCGPCGTESTTNPRNYKVIISNLQSIGFPPPVDRNSCPEWNKHPYPTVCPFDNSSIWII